MPLSIISSELQPGSPVLGRAGRPITLTLATTLIYYIIPAGFALIVNTVYAANAVSVYLNGASTIVFTGVTNYTTSPPLNLVYEGGQTITFNSSSAAYVHCVLVRI